MHATGGSACPEKTTAEKIALSHRLQLERTALAQPAQLHLVLLIERGEPSPIIPGREQREKRNGEVIVRLDGEHDHVEKIGADRNFDKWQPAALAAVFLVLQIDGPAFDCVLRGAHKSAFDTGQRLE